MQRMIGMIFVSFIKSKLSSDEFYARNDKKVWLKTILPMSAVVTTWFIVSNTTPAFLRNSNVIASLLKLSLKLSELINDFNFEESTSSFVETMRIISTLVADLLDLRFEPLFTFHLSEELDIWSASAIVAVKYCFREWKLSLVTFWNVNLVSIE